MNPVPGKAILAGRIISGLAAVPFVLSAAMKFSGSPFMVKGFEHLGWPQSLIRPLGVLESLCVILYLVPASSVLGAILLTGYIGGAIATHSRIGEPVLLQIAMGILVWLGLFLREPRLMELLPVRAKDFKVEREIVIGLPRSEVFAYLKPLSNFRHWNPFLRKDPHARISMRGSDGEVGTVASWEGNRALGSGEQEITRIVDGERVEFELRFKTPFQETNRGYFSAEDAGESLTRVRWGMTGKSAFPRNVIGLFLNCDRMIEREFDLGLHQLKSVLEKR